MMRKVKIVIIFCLLICIGCSNDDSQTGFFYELIAIEDVITPKDFVQGETYTFTVMYFRPTDCHSFSGFDFEKLGNKRTISVINLALERETCNDLQKNDLIKVSFDFYVGKEDSYTFRFWKGVDKEGNDLFLTKEIPVL